MGAMCDDKLPSFSDDRKCTTITSFGSKIFSAGGETNYGEGLSSVAIFDTSDSSPVWTEVESMSKERYNATSVVHAGILYVFGGYLQDYSLSSRLLYDGEKFDTATDSWSPVARMRVARCCAGGAFFKGRIFILRRGGMEATGGIRAQAILMQETTSSVEAYDVERDTWTTLPNMLYKRSSSTVLVSCGRLFVIGGFGYNMKRDVPTEEYDPKTNTWIARPELTIPNEDPHVFALPIPASLPISQY